MIDISKIREGDEVLVRTRVDSVHPTIGDGRLRVHIADFGERFSVDIEDIAELHQAFHPGDHVTTDDYPPDAPHGEVRYHDGDFVIVRFPDMEAPQVLPATRLVRVDMAPAIQAAAE